MATKKKAPCKTPTKKTLKGTKKVGDTKWMWAHFNNT